MTTDRIAAVLLLAGALACSGGHPTACTKNGAPCVAAGGGQAGAGGGNAGGTATGGSGGSGGGGRAFTGDCDPIAQVGCTQGQRCAWVGGAAVKCVEEGTIDAGAPCTDTDAGVDDCKSGSACAYGSCETICDLTAKQCDPTHACIQVPSLFQAPFMPPLAGVCVASCDPVTQVRATDGAAACGSPDPSAPSLGCYGFPGEAFTCAPAGPATEVSDVAVSPVSLDACAPGFQPVLTALSEASAIICVAFCKPAPTSLEDAGQAAGAADSGYTCPDRGAGGTHECHYWWSLESAPYDSAGDTVGYCFDYTKYTIGTGYAYPPMAYPSCTQLSSTLHTYDTVLTDAQLFGCIPLP